MSPDRLTWGLLRQAESTTSWQTFPSPADPKLEPFLNAANRAHINSHSVGPPSARTMIPHSRGHWAQGRVGIHLFETAYRSHVRPRSPPNLGSGGSEASIHGFEAVRESGILPNLDLQFGSLRDQAERHVAPKRDQQLACYRNDGNAADLATPVANAFVEPSTESAAGG